MQRRDFVKLGAFFIAIPDAWAKHVSRADWRPSVFDDRQNETVIALTELIIPATGTPGAKAAHVNRYIDLFLRDGEPEPRARFLKGLEWLDGYAMREHGDSFVRCSAAQQTSMLRALDEGTGEGHDFFWQVKSLTAQIYYSTEIGYRELNKGGRVPAGFGCRHSSHG